MRRAVSQRAVQAAIAASVAYAMDRSGCLYRKAHFPGFAFEEMNETGLQSGSNEEAENRLTNLRRQDA